jgi:hypothetical protein
MSGTNTLVTITASIIEHSRRKKTIKQINKTNEINRRITDIGITSVSNLMPSFESHGNVLVSGGKTHIRELLTLQNIEQAVNANLPVVVLHENNAHIEYDIRTNYQHLPFVRFVSENAPYYDPILRLNDFDSAKLLYEASKYSSNIATDGGEYLRLVSAICRKQGTNPYIRLLGGCPHNKLGEIVTNMEDKGLLSADEALYFNNNLPRYDKVISSVELYMEDLCKDGKCLSWKNGLGKSTSIEECVKASGIIVIDVNSFDNKTLIGLVASELNRCKKYGKEIRLIIDGSSIESCELLVDDLKKCTHNTSWYITCPDIRKMIGGKEELSTWIALSHKTIILQNSLKVAEGFAKELGEYDRIDISQTTSGGANYGRFGLHMGGNGGLTTNTKRDFVIKPEEITNFKDNEFIMLNNNTATVLHGFIQ